jgi:hypothetical protein
MKTSIILGAGLLALAATLVLRNATSDPARASNDALPSIESEQTTETASPRRVNTHKLVPAPQTRTTGVAILDTLEAETDPDRRSELLAHTVESVPNTELPGLLDSLMRLESPTAAELRQELIYLWAETHGTAAAAWAAQLPASPTTQETLTQVALGWAATDLPAALDWVQTLPAGESKNTILLGLGYETARTDAIQALELAATLEPTRQRDDLIEHALSQWANTDFTTAVQWAETNISDANLRQRLLAAAAVAVAGQDGSSAATLAANTLKPGAEQDRAAVAIIQRWVQNEPERAAAWVTQFPDTPARQTTAQNLVAIWAAQDEAAAANWLHALPEGTLRTAGMTAYTQTQLAANQ